MKALPVPSIRTLITAAVASVALAVGWVAGIARQNGLASPIAAAWVEALGTFSAVVVAVWAATASLTADARRRHQVRVDFVNALSDSSQLALTGVDAIRVAMSNKPADFASKVLELKASDKAPLHKLLEAPLTDWPSPILYLRAARFAEALATFELAARTANGVFHSVLAERQGVERRSAELQKAQTELDQSIAGHSHPSTSERA